MTDGRATGGLGYAGKILRVDLSSRAVSESTTADYSERFLGGRGLASKIYWDEAAANATAHDPDNLLIFSTGPLAGFTGLAGSNWEVCGKSSVVSPEAFCYGSGAGSWGSRLKFAGYDALVIRGQSEKPVYLSVGEAGVEVRDASFLWGKGAIETREALKESLGSGVRVATIGPAGENLVPKAITLADEDAAAVGFGAVMGAKLLKAIAVSGEQRLLPADPQKLRDLREHLRNLRSGVPRPGVYARPDIRLEEMGKRKKVACYGCITGCSRTTYTADDGQKGKLMCKGTLLYFVWAKRYYGDNYGDVPFLASHLCNQYGVDMDLIDTMTRWLDRCFREGVLTDKGTELPLSKIGSFEYVETLIRKIALQEGTGAIFAQGLVKAAETLGREARSLVDDAVCLKTGDNYYYDPRLYISTGILYATEPRPSMAQLHEVVFPIFRWEDCAHGTPGAFLTTDELRVVGKRFFGSELAVDFSTYEGKALAAKMIQDREYAKSSLILCDFSWPITDSRNAANHLGDAAAESAVLSAVTGRSIDEQALLEVGERVFNLRRAISVREGHRGRVDDVLQDSDYTVPLSRCAYEHHEFTNPNRIAPGKNGEVISLKDAHLDRTKFEGVKDDYYRLRGWDVATGLQTKAQLEALGLADVAMELAAEGLVVQ